MTYRVLRALTSFGSVGPTPVNAIVTHDAVDTGRAFPLVESTRRGGAGRSTPASMDLGNIHLGVQITARTATSYTLQRANSAELVDHDHYTAVIEDQSADQGLDGFYVRDFRTLQMGAGATSETGPAISSIVDPTRAMVWPLAIRSSAPGQTWGAGAVEARLTASLEPQVERTSGAALHRTTVATIEWGAAWRVRRVDVAVSDTGGLDVPVSGFGSAPWQRKFAVVSYRVPLGAHNQADNLLLRPDPDSADRMLAWTPAGAAAGTYNATVYVLDHPRILVAHWSSFDVGVELIGGLDVLEDESEPPPSWAQRDDSTTVLVQATNTGGTLGYPRQFWGHTLQGGVVRLRRGRADSARFSQVVYQAVRWPGFPAGRQKATVAEAPQKAL